MLVGDKIKHIRELSNMDRKVVADKLGISPQQYANIENNISHIDDTKLELLSELFKVDKEAILSFDTQKIFHQINNDNSSGCNLGIFYQQNNDLIKQLLDNNNKLIEIMEKKIVFIEEELKRKNSGIK